MKSLQTKLFYVLLCASLLFALVGIRPAYAATLTVINNNDSGAGSLRQAIIDAASGDTITFDSSLAGQTINLTSTLTISTSMTIDGSALNPHQVTISGNNSAEVMNVNSGQTLSLDNITISHGNSLFGGGIYNQGTLNVTNSTFSDNTATGDGAEGGAIDNGGTLTVTSSTFSSNSISAGGGDGARGAGIANFGSATIANSTFSGNSASESTGGPAQGGAIYNNGALYITNSTFSGNNVSTSGTPQGGGIFNDFAGTLNVFNSIIANSTNGGDCVSSGAIVAEKNNLLKDSGTNACSLVNGINGDIIGSDPNLGSLANNGGPTQTMALLAGSPAIDAGDNTVCNASVGSPNYGAGGKDQRGVTRPQGTHCDIGAYEYGPVIPLVSSSNPSANATLSSLSTITVTFNQDMLNDGSSKAANYVNNYILVERGANGTFDTQSCKGSVQSDDVQQTISNASYSNSGGNYVATLTLASSLATGNYRLFICGTTSIWSVAGLELNNGNNDTTVDFTISANRSGNTGNGSSNAATLPRTGFAPGVVTTLPIQPADKQYSSTDLILNIPSIGVKTSIVGVPQSGDSWDVSWLGNNAGWLNGTAFPTWTGNSVITGHVWNADNTPGIFVHLKDLKYGDQIQIQAFGQTYTYEVRESQAVWPDQVSTVMQHEEYAYVTLVTCEDYNFLFTTYSFRRMVRAVLISVK